MGFTPGLEEKTQIWEGQCLSGLVFNREKSLALKSEDKGLEDGALPRLLLSTLAAVSSVKPVNDLRPTGLVSR